MSAARRQALKLGLPLLAAVLSTPAAVAWAESGPKRGSSDSFSFCREQEKAGDARACWKVWLEKYRTASSEAELAYAEEHSSKPGARPAHLVLTSKPESTIVIDGQPIGSTPRDGLDVAPGEHRITFQSNGRVENRTFTLAPGEARAVAVDFDAPPAQTAAKVEPVVAAPAADLLDFCAISPRTGARKERVVVLAPSGTRALEDDAALAGVDAARLVREVFPARFALDRFHNVTTAIPAKEGWEDRESLTLGEVRAFVGEASESKDSPSTRLEREKRFLDYSLGCTDWLVVPTVTSHESKPSFTMNGSVAVFRRHGDELDRVILASETVPMLRGALAPAKESPASRATYISGLPLMRCLVGKTGTGTDTGLGLTDCGKTGEGTIEQAFGDRNESESPACEEARDEHASASAHTLATTTCEIRERSQELALAFHEDLRKLDAWLPPAHLMHAFVPATSFGRSERVRLGDAFEVRDARDRRIGFFTVARVGPGGSEGELEPTLLQRRLGDAPAGSRLERYWRAGLLLEPYISAGMLMGSGATTTVETPTSSQDFALPGPLVGGGIGLGYDISSLVGWSGTSVRASAGILTGSGLNTNLTLIPVDMWLEHALHASRRLTFSIGLGGGVQLGSVTLLSSTDEGVDPMKMSSFQYGPAGRASVHVMLTPAIGVSAEGLVRAPLNHATYTESDGKTMPPEWQSRSDSLGTIALNLGLTVGF